MNIWISQIIATVFLEALGTLRKEYNKLHVLCTFDIWWQTKNKKKKKQPRNRHPVRTGFKILVMLQDSTINLPWQNNIKDKKHDAPSSTGSNPISGVHHSFIPLPKKNLFSPYILPACSNFTRADFLQPEFLCFLLMTGINEFKKGQSIFNTSKNTQNKATRGNLFILKTLLPYFMRYKGKRGQKKDQPSRGHSKSLAWVSMPITYQ